MDQKRKAAQFAKLHVKGTPLVLYNAWDAGSAKAVVAAGAKAIATSSWSPDRVGPPERRTTADRPYSVMRDTPLPRSGMHKVDKKALLAELVPARPAT